ncbi:5'-3' exonuclease, partial [Mycobacterium tuberculosis TB_RSA169]
SIARLQKALDTLPG